MIDRDFEEKCRRIAELIVQSNKNVVFTGAGISTESGIPDFRGKDGIWTKVNPDDFTIQKYLASEENRRMQWRMLVQGGLVTAAKPNPAHLAVAELEKLGKLDCVITQNIDNLHQAAGNSPDIVFELHGNMQFVRCLKCNERYPMSEILKRLETVDIPDCDKCGGILKPDAVFFGEALPQWVLSEAARRASQCELCIVIGSTLVVYPAAYIPIYALEAGAKLVIINIGDTPLDSRATVRMEAKAGEAMSRIISIVKEIMGR